MIEYTPLPKSVWKAIPEIAEYRLLSAQMYRSARKESRHLAFLLRKRLKAAEKITKDQIAEKVFNGGSI